MHRRALSRPIDNLFNKPEKTRKYLRLFGSTFAQAWWIFRLTSAQALREARSWISGTKSGSSLARNASTAQKKRWCQFIFPPFKVN